MLGGKPLVAWTIEAAKSAAYLNRLAISTDSEEIAAVARSLGVEVPFMRPESKARDDTPTVEVVRHALLTLTGFDAVFTLQVTNPFRSAADIDGAIDLMERLDADSVIGVTPVGDAHPWRMYKVTTTMNPIPFCRDAIPFLRRQELPPVYLRCGAVYLTRTKLIDDGKMVGPNCRAVVVPRERAIAIDEPVDLKIAEALKG